GPVLRRRADRDPDRCARGVAGLGSPADGPACRAARGDRRCRARAAARRCACQGGEPMNGSRLVARDVRMVFGGVVALDRASIEVAPGRVIGLIGRNGSGKSTLFNCLTGFLKPTAGSITLDGRDITGE